MSINFECSIDGLAESINLQLALFAASTNGNLAKFRSLVGNVKPKGFDSKR